MGGHASKGPRDYVLWQLTRGRCSCPLPPERSHGKQDDQNNQHDGELQNSGAAVGRNMKDPLYEIHCPLLSRRPFA